MLHQNPAAVEALRANPEEVYKPNDDGDNYFHAVLSLEKKTLEEQKKIINSEKTMKSWMLQSFGINLTYIARWTACLRHEQFRQAFFQLVQTHFGRNSFNLTLAEKIVSSRLDQVSYAQHGHSNSSWFQCE
jgi:hypothetical protein